MNPEFSISPATPEDVQPIIALIHELAEYEKLAHEVEITPELLHKSMFDDAKCHALIARQKGAVVGYALFFYNFSTFLGRPGIYLEDLYVQREQRGAGIGKALIKHLAQRAVQEGCGRFEWTVLGWNAPSIAFYKSLGAQEMSQWKIMRVTGDALESLAS
jgi:GNAT superfamily N-acetyltransferase